jgi:hypothetical protein
MKDRLLGTSIDVTRTIQEVEVARHIVARDDDDARDEIWKRLQK